MKILMMVFVIGGLLITGCSNSIVTTYISKDNEVDDIDQVDDADQVDDDENVTLRDPTYYISSSVGDDGFDGKQPEPDGIGGGPWAMLKKISEQDEDGAFTIKPGDIVALKRGDTWFESTPVREGDYKDSVILIHPKITGGREPTIITAYGEGARPVIDGGNMGDENNQYLLFGVYGAKNLIIENVHLKVGQYTASDGAAIYIEADFRDVKNVRIDRVVIDGRDDLWERDNGNGIAMISNESGFTISEIEISNCEITGVGGFFPDHHANLTENYGVFIAGAFDDIHISGNEFYHNYQAMKICGGTTYMLEKNFVAGTTAGHGIEFFPSFGGISGVSLFQNIILGTIGNGVSVNNVSNLRAFNNTIYNISGNSIAFSNNSEFGGTVNNSEIRNNIFAGVVQMEDNISDGSEGNVFSHNIYYNPLDETSENPLFIRPYSKFTETLWTFCYSMGECGDFHLQGDSPAIDAGSGVGLTDDFDGHEIVGVIDIGAYEYQ